MLTRPALDAVHIHGHLLAVSESRLSRVSKPRIATVSESVSAMRRIDTDVFRRDIA